MATIYPKDFFNQASKKIHKASCFVLMPFDPKFKEIYDSIKDTLESEELNIECNRADDFHQPHIIQTILNGISKAEFIIADLTELNANVFYELGLAHSIKDIQKVVILTQDLKYVPFDLRQFRCIVYEQSITGAKKLKEELVKTFNEATKDSFRLKLIEDKIVPFAKRLVGVGNFIYELSFESTYVGHDAIKLQIHFTQLSVDKTKTNLESQFLYLSEDKLSDKINNIPWTVNLVKIEGKEVTISIDKK
jgi:hypothetical protein